MATFGNDKFQKRAKLFVANFPQEEGWESQLRQMCSQFGEVGEVYVGKGFAFVTFDYRCNAEVAKMQLSKVVLDHSLGPLDVRWAASNACLEVHNLGPLVSNEVLLEAFLPFGEVERAVVVVDAQARKSKGYGYVEFVSHTVASKVVARLSNEHFILPGAPWPVRVKLAQLTDDDVGLPESRIKEWDRLKREEDSAPHMAKAGTPEGSFAEKWVELEKQKKERMEEVEAWYAGQRENLRKQQAAATEAERKKAALAQQQALRKQQEMERQAMAMQQMQQEQRAMLMMQEQRMLAMQQEQALKMQQE
eukprot:CAMPEP_0118954036 /NCGR_PEP_ID=MMETSP1169-20130426/57585_1 /TAXON_ID=36882 /ORGANISM="Pyramimonas obovata, Strain CCMP722" /LENGTH=305 /DNA_ID=CAMNT_0006901607 /DNA_START=130 /DNA_END=1044 /DNA_ORIENTATION=+